MKLDVWLEGKATPVGYLVRAEDKSLVFTYSHDVSPQHRLSMSLPITDSPYSDAACTAYFGNLIFESRELDQVLAKYQLDRDDIGGVLYHLGADCPGAISVSPHGAGPGKQPGIFPDDYRELPQDQVLAIVSSLHFSGKLPDNSSDPSPVAGVQPKLAILYHEGRYYLPKEGTGAPTTHILKVSPRKDLKLTCHEAALLTLAGQVGIHVAETDLLTFEDPDTSAEIFAVLSTRFDRKFEGGKITRVHVEDLCQALGLSAHLKYERNAAEDGPRFSAAEVGKVAKATAVPALFQRQFFAHTLFNLMVGNTDNHAKNTSILYANGQGELAPLYDVVPITMDDTVTHQFAFKVGGAEYAEDLTIEDIENLMSDLGYRKPKFAGRWIKLLEGIVDNAFPVLEPQGGKELADGVAAQFYAVREALDLDLNIETRDYYPRKVRDEKPDLSAGGWGMPS